MSANRPTLLLALVLSSSAAACAGNPAAPFDQMKTAQVTAFRLQNYEPPPQAAAPAQPQGPAMIPGLPPEIQKWVQAGASMLPPGLLPPGLLGGVAPQAPAPQQQDFTPRFHGFRILGQVPVADTKLREEIGDILGIDKNFDASFAPCNYAEFGYSIQNAGQPPVDVLVSFSCDKVIPASSFGWPNKNVGLTPDTVKRLAKVSQTIFGPG
jgi:hypothetical protein